MNCVQEQLKMKNGLNSLSNEREFKSHLKQQNKQTGKKLLNFV